MKKKGKKDEKILAVAASDPLYSEVNDYSQVFAHTVREIEHFFSIYKDLEGKRVETQGWRDASFARSLIVESQRAFEAAEAKAMGKKA